MTVATSTPKTLPAGIYCPTLTFFQPTAEQDLDLETHARHMEFLAKSGIQGVVLQGSTGEAVALDRDERKQVSAADVYRCAYRCRGYVVDTITHCSCRQLGLPREDLSGTPLRSPLCLSSSGGHRRGVR
jgi:hypothetical protein